MDEERSQKKKAVKKLSATEVTVHNLTEELATREEGAAQLREEVEASRKQVQNITQTIDELAINLNNLQEQHQTILSSLEDIQVKFNPLVDELTMYKIYVA